FVPDGKTLVVADAKNTYRWELPTGKLLGRAPRAGTRAPAAFSPDGTILAAEDAGGAGLWEVDTGKKLRQLEQPHRGDGETRGGVGFVFSPDGKTLAGGDYNVRLGPQRSTLGGILLWSTATGKLLHFFETPAFIVEQVVVSPDGRFLASRTTAPGTVAGQEFRLWELASGKPLQVIQTWSGGLAFTADSQTLISAGEKLSAWETSSGKEVSRFKAADEKEVWFASLAIAADGRTLAAGNRLGRASLWDVNTGKRLRQLQLHPLHVDGDGERVSSPVMPLVFSSDGRALVFGNDYDQITIASAATGQRLHQFRSRCTARSLALSPDGKTLASTGPTNARVIHLWETASGKERLQIGENRDAFRSVVFSADGKTLISGGQETIRFWDAVTGKEVGQLKGHRGAVTALALLPDGKGLVSGSSDTTILVWQGMPRKGKGPGLAKLTGPELEVLWADL